MRTTKSLREIERLLADAVRKVEGCEEFGGLVVELAQGEAGRNGCNWTPGFINYGGAHEIKCKEALQQAVHQLALQFDALG